MKSSFSDCSGLEEHDLPSSETISLLILDLEFGVATGFLHLPASFGKCLSRSITWENPGVRGLMLDMKPFSFENPVVRALLASRRNPEDVKKDKIRFVVCQYIFIKFV